VIFYVSRTVSFTGVSQYIKYKANDFPFMSLPLRLEFPFWAKRATSMLHLNQNPNQVPILFNSCIGIIATAYFAVPIFLNSTPVAQKPHQ